MSARPAASLSSDLLAIKGQAAPSAREQDLYRPEKPSPPMSDLRAITVTEVPPAEPGVELDEEMPPPEASLNAIQLARLAPEQRDGAAEADAAATGQAVYGTARDDTPVDGVMADAVPGGGEGVDGAAPEDVAAGDLPRQPPVAEAAIEATEAESDAVPAAAVPPAAATPEPEVPAAVRAAAVPPRPVVARPAAARPVTFKPLSSETRAAAPEDKRPVAAMAEGRGQVRRWPTLAAGALAAGVAVLVWLVATHRLPGLPVPAVIPPEGLDQAAAVAPETPATPTPMPTPTPTQTPTPTPTAAEPQTPATPLPATTDSAVREEPAPAA